ncbi:MAG: DUF1572 family protein [Gemmatimonadaceae bacterium]
MSVETQFLTVATANFQEIKTSVDRAIAQVNDEQFFAALDAESNSIAVIVKHVAGNLRSRWTDFLNSDGEKADRNRDAEFEISESATRAELMSRWEDGWRLAFEALNSLGPDDLMKTIRIRGEPHTVVKAIIRQLTHAASHGGQIVFLAKHFAGDSWQTLSIPRGGSNAFNAAKESRTAH